MYVSSRNRDPKKVRTKVFEKAWCQKDDTVFLMTHISFVMVVTTRCTDSHFDVTPLVILSGRLHGPFSRLVVCPQVFTFVN